MSIFIVKILITGSLPTLIDQSFFILLGLHLSTFFYFHSRHGKNFLNKIMKSDTRLVLQETFKGYGKGISLLSSINQGFKFETNAIYFIFVIVIRCLASSSFKLLFLSKIVKKKAFKLKKTKVNFIFNAVPTICIYITLLFVRNCLPTSFHKCLEDNITFFFITFMAISRLIRSFWKVLNMRKRKDKKKIKKQQKKLLKKKQKEQLKLIESQIEISKAQEAPLIKLQKQESDDQLGSATTEADTPMISEDDKKGNNDESNNIEELEFSHLSPHRNSSHNTVHNRKSNKRSTTDQSNSDEINEFDEYLGYPVNNTTTKTGYSNSSSFTDKHQKSKIE
ncbi:UNKNOWN [Stylonychia lemnae]|uniref:Uncharacterized protein n=1 Tax=Stylonychia lemnae TaxID=5949 RepID=A0A078B644_STYLE|nr:UNKNOWN [Stylonychia lemnae]|eukprot:CDW88782.1 UNKNOWN [Stylonychia lemnae]